MGMYDYDEGSYFYDDYGNVDHKYADEVDAAERGRADPEAYWICTDRGAWHKNSFYTGTPAGEVMDLLPVRHPELEDLLEDLMSDVPAGIELKDCIIRVPVDKFEDIPF